MNNYVMIELEKGNKYILIDMINNNEKKYFLVAEVKSDENNISNEFDICLYNEEKNWFEKIDDEMEYNIVRDTFDKRLDEKKQQLKNLEIHNLSNIIKLKVIDIDGFKYTFERTNGQTLVMDIEIFGNFKIEINDYIYMLEETTKENITIRFGPIYTDKTEIIKILRKEEKYYLQRYFG